MFNRLKNRKLAKKLASIGSHVDTSYMLYINNLDPLCFATKAEALDYLKHYRAENEIFKLQIFRIETYSL